MTVKTSCDHSSADSIEAKKKEEQLISNSEPSTPQSPNGETHFHFRISPDSEQQSSCLSTEAITNEDANAESTISPLTSKSETALDPSSVRNSVGTTIRHQAVRLPVIYCMYIHNF
jgi:hypothetical protein